MKRGREGEEEAHGEPQSKHPHQEIKPDPEAQRGDEPGPVKQEDNSNSHHHDQQSNQQGRTQQSIDDEEDEKPVLPKSTSKAAVKKGSECPYLDTVSRHVRAAWLFSHCGLLGSSRIIHAPSSCAQLACSTALMQNLDFDFEKCCSITLSHVNVYVCLVCGKYYQVRFARLFSLY